MPKEGDHIKYKLDRDDEWKRAKVVSHGGKLKLINTEAGLI